ncbi:hypothetical protein BOTBODRAFT_132722 [Botryobasidium botryosum FD-172 SS1]|uniref:Centractin n=1 Tax=Botryobasidium botryosum (strain FD-172 SS1) TaxID=930990 RepID=A0A067MHL9_BOTB1|nr:hypothetical protein BOTBODRAFT_132722 [Botryobasidium botryosum FD-172 SS1]
MANGAVVIDNGSGYIKAGRAGDGEPRTVFPTLVGIPKHASVAGGATMYVGQEAQDRRGILRLNHPIEHGIINDWDDLAEIWTHTFSELRVASQDQPVLFTEASLNPNANRERLASIMFDDFGAPAIYVANQALLSLHASGRASGVVVDIGDSATCVTPIQQGTLLSGAVRRLRVAGRDITDHLLWILQDSDLKFTTSAEYQIVVDIKEALCYVALNHDEEMSKNPEGKAYDLPGGQVIQIGNERFRAPELLFSPKLGGLESDGLIEVIHDSINKCGEDIRSEMYGNIILAGGSTLFPGMKDRLEQDLSKLAPAGTKVQVIAPANRKYSAWVEGSKFASQSNFSDLCCSKAEYDEHGPSIFQKKFQQV